MLKVITLGRRKIPVHAFGALYRSLTKMNESIQPTLTTHPPAKLNLFLELLSKRQDGFHEIDTVMLPINWCDTLQLSKTETGNIPNGGNGCTRDARELQRTKHHQPGDS